MEFELNENERLDDLQLKGLKIIQNTRMFCFGMDAVLLAHFAEGRPGDRVVDLGTGTGIIPILLAGHTRVSFIAGIEIQKAMVDMARRSVEYNNLEDIIEIVNGDLKSAPDILGENRYNLVVSNPPYKKGGSGIINKHDSIAISRHEILCSLDDVLKSASSLLKHGGRFAMVHQTERMMEILYKMRSFNMEPKRIRLIHPNINKAPNLMLIEGIKGGKPHLKWMPPLFIYNIDGTYTKELKEIYNPVM